MAKRRRHTDKEGVRTGKGMRSSFERSSFERTSSCHP